MLPNVALWIGAVYSLREKGALESAPFTTALLLAHSQVENLRVEQTRAEFVNSVPSAASTTYRSLNLLVAVGLVRFLDLGNSGEVIELTFPEDLQILEVYKAVPPLFARGGFLAVRG